MDNIQTCCVMDFPYKFVVLWIIFYSLNIFDVNVFKDLEPVGGSDFLFLFDLLAHSSGLDCVLNISLTYLNMISGLLNTDRETLVLLKILS